MKVFSTAVKLVLLVFVFIVSLAHSASAQGPSWSSGYPKVIGGSTSIDINVQTDANGSVYYAIYSAPQSGLTASQLKSAAQNGGSSALQRRGTIAVTALSPSKITEATLTQSTAYYVYVVGESAAGLMSDSKISVTTTSLASRLQGFTNYSNASVADYMMYFPETYYKDTNTYPVLIYLHGDDQMTKGAAGNPSVLLTTGLPQIINQGRDIPMIMAAPQGIWAWDNTESDLDAFIEYIKTKYRINTSQIFLSGISAGGKGVFQYTNVYKTKIRAIVPVSTWPEPTDVNNFTSVPVWSFMGASDTFGGLYNWIADLKAIGGDATFTSYPGGHEPAVWNAVYSGSRGDDIYTWLLSRGQPPPPVNKPPVVNAGADQTVTLPLAQLVLSGTATDTDGTIASVLWTKISGPAVVMSTASTTSLTLTGLVAGTYVFQLMATDNSAAVTSDQITVTVNAAPVTVVSREFDVNLTWAYNLQGGTWNDFVTTSGGSVGNSMKLTDITKASSSITLSVAAPFQDGTNNHGVVPGVYGNNVMMYYLRSTTTKIGMLKLSGLDVSKVYDFSILSSNVDAWYSSSTLLTVGGQSATVNATSNASALVSFTSVAPNASGEITITVAPSTTSSTNNGIINAFILKEKSGTVVNTPPVVSAGADRQVTLPLAQLQLTGTATDADGTIASVLWTEVSGPAATLTNAATSVLTITNLTAGTYNFQYTAKDNSGAGTSDQVVVTVNPAANIAPVVNAGADQNLTLPLSSVVLAGTASDSDGTIASFSWLEISGPAVTMANTTTSSLILTNLLAGTYTFQLTVKDNSGATTSDQVVVTINSAANKLPVVNAGVDQQFTLPLTKIQITGTATDPDGTIRFMRWTKISGSAVTLSTDSTTTLTLTNLLAGTYVFQLSATDNSGASASDQVIITINSAGNLPPVVNAGVDQQFTLPLSQIQIAGTAVDPDGSIGSVGWTLLSGPAVTLTGATGKILTLTNFTAGVYVLQFTATDNGGLSVSDQVVLTVISAPVVPREFDVNLTWAYNLQGGTWNDFVTTSGGSVGNSMTLTDINKATSAITLSIAAPFQDGTNNHGVVPGLYPNNVMMYYLRSTTTKIGVLQLSGLDITKQYDFSILSSNVDVWYPSDTKFTIGAQSGTVNGKGNSSTLVKFTNMAPATNGQLNISVAPATTSSTNNGIITAFILTEHGATGAASRVESDESVVAEGEPGFAELPDYATVYPNPTDGFFTVAINPKSTAAQTYSLVFHDSRGAQVYTQQLVIEENQISPSVNLSSEFMQAGIYILTVSSRESGVSHVKIVKR